MTRVVKDLQRLGPGRYPRLSPAEARDYVARFTRGHSENFHVLSFLLPRRYRPDVEAVYAFCRWADDLADEVSDRARALELLAWWRDELRGCFAGDPRHPVFVSLGETVRRHDLPIDPFDDLISAFEQDQRVARYETWDDLLAYCRLSANPVGQILLRIFGYTDEERLRLSDRTCTALQLANHWQDVRRDVLERDRIYIPRDTANAHGLDLDAMADEIHAHQEKEGFGRFTPCLVAAFRATLRDLMDSTWPMFSEGKMLIPLVSADVRPVLALFTQGGQSAMHKIAAANYDTLTSRPRVGRFDKLRILARVLLGV